MKDILILNSPLLSFHIHLSNELYIVFLLSHLKLILSLSMSLMDSRWTSRLTV